MSDRYRAIAPHASEFPNPIELRSGDSVSYERRPTEWPGWLWCTTDAGARGWVPEAYLVLEGRTATVRRSYTARELDVAPGDTLSGTLVESGWLWATKDDGKAGWVPLNVLEVMSP